MINFSNFVILIIFVGIIFVVSYLSSQNCKIQPVKIKYKYLSKSFKEEQDYPEYVSNIFGDMFIEPTPWIIGQSGNKKRRIN